MSRKLFKETFETITEQVKEKGKGFSKKDFNILMEAYINDPEFIVEDAKVMGDDYLVTRKKPVKEFRKMLGSMLKELGVDSSEVNNFIDNYEFKKVDPLYDFINNFIYYYIKTGRKYKLFEKEDITASIKLKQRGKVTKTNKKGQIVEQDDYYALGQESPCPKWKKKIKDDQGKVCKAFSKMIVDEF